MKKIHLILLSALFNTVSAQNIQVHYDLGKSRNYLTSTFEIFKTDNLGNTFGFVDVDFNTEKYKHPSSAYLEITRCFTLAKSPLSAHIEYNGGLFFSNPQSTSGSFTGYPINNTYLAGIDYGWHDKSFTKFLTFQVLYKYIADKNPVSFQLTGVWDLSFFNKKVSLIGFADFWREDNTNFYKSNGEDLSTPTLTKFVFMAEPQIWYNFTPHFSLGSEVEFGVNFGAVHGLKVCPTLGTKFTF